MALQPITRPRADPRVEAEEVHGGRSAMIARPPQYRIILRIRHPELDPAGITSELGWKPNQSWKPGEQAVTPKGTKLPGTRSDGLWSRSFPFGGKGNIVRQLDRILDHLLEHKDLFDRLNKMEAQLALYVQLPGHTNNGDRIPWQVLRKLVDLQMAFEFEVFPNSL